MDCINSIPNIKSAILINNDDIDNFINRKLFENNGVIDISTFRSATKALSYLTNTHTSYDIILVDLHMPFVDGFEFIEQFRQSNFQKNHGIVYLLTNSINPADKTKCFEEDIKFIEKPLSIQKLKEILNQ